VLHPALHLLATRPQWLAEHAEAYADLAAAEFGDAAGAWRRAALLGAATVCALGVAATLAGVALMLWAVMPTLPPQTAWLLWATPALPLAAAGLGAGALRWRRRAEAFVVLREQLQLDMALLRAMERA
jgi:hypothetical protein